MTGGAADPGMPDGGRRCGECGGVIGGDPSLMGLCPRCLMSLVARDRRPSPPHPPDLPGFHVEGLIGRGGMGLVYAARRVADGRAVAVKVLSVADADDPVGAARFAAEGRVLSALDHPNVVTAHQFGRAGAVLFLVMDRVDGPTLRAVLGGGRLGVDRAVTIAGQLCDALAYAHGQGVLHRDVKPENVLLDDGGRRARLADFGLARAVTAGGQARPEPSLTGSLEWVGTRDYVAPECRRGRPADERSDLFALGVVLYEMLVGHPPAGHFARPGQVDPAARRLDRVVLRCLSDDPARRYPSAAAVRAALVVAASPRWPLAAVTAAAVVVVTVAGLAAATAFRRADRHPVMVPPRVAVSAATRPSSARAAVPTATAPTTAAPAATAPTRWVSPEVKQLDMRPLGLGDPSPFPLR